MMSNDTGVDYRSRPERTFNVVRLREYLPLGQRVEAFALDSWTTMRWREFARGTSIGNCKLVRGKPMSTTKVRLRITRSPVMSRYLRVRAVR
jgi:alpha-L-fucosidase